MSLLTIIIPCYNSGKSLAKNIDSLLLQLSQENEEDARVDLLIVDDGSTDDTASVIYEKIKGIENAKLISTKNFGASKAREYGLSQTQSDYVFFCDADDYVDEAFLKEIIKAIIQGPDIIYFSSKVIIPNDNEKKNKVFFEHIETYNQGKDFILNQLYRDQWTSACWTYVFRRALLETSGASFTNRKVHEDHDFTLKLMFSAKKIICLPGVLYYQIETKGSLTKSNKNESYLLERYFAYQECISWLVSKNEDNNSKLVSKYIEWSIRSLFDINKQINRRKLSLNHVQCIRLIVTDKYGMFLVFLKMITNKFRKGGD